MRKAFQLKHIPTEEVLAIVEEHWRLRNLMPKGYGPGGYFPPNDAIYPTDCCTVLMEKYGIPYKMARMKLEQLIARGVLGALLTPCVPADPNPPRRGA